MTKPVEVITSVQRRRRWSRAEKERIVAAALEPGAVASEVAREAGIHASQLFRWRQELCKQPPTPATFHPVAIVPEPAVAFRPDRRPAIGLHRPPPRKGGMMRGVGPPSLVTTRRRHWVSAPTRQACVVGGEQDAGHGAGPKTGRFGGISKNQQAKSPRDLARKVR